MPRRDPLANPKARTPFYDLGAVLARNKEAEEIVLAPGPEQPNASYRPPPAPVKPWSDRYPAVLYTTLAAAILAMGYVTVQFLMKVKREG